MTETMSQLEDFLNLLCVYIPLQSRYMNGRKIFSRAIQIRLNHDIKEVAKVKRLRLENKYLKNVIEIFFYGIKM